MPYKFDTKLKKCSLNTDETIEIHRLMDIISNMIIHTHFIYPDVDSNQKYIINPAIIGGKGGRDKLSKSFSNDIDVLICNTNRYSPCITIENTPTTIGIYISKIIKHFNEKYKFIELKLCSNNLVDNTYLSTISLIQSFSIINRIILEYKYNGSILNKSKSLYFNIDFIITNYTPYKFFLNGLFSSDKCLTYDNHSYIIYSDDSSKHDMEINDDIKDIWKKNTKNKITYLTIDWMYYNNNLLYISPVFNRGYSDEEYDKSIRIFNIKKQSCKNKLIAAILKKNQTGWIVPNSNIVLMKYNSLTTYQKDIIHNYLLRDDFEFPFLSNINMNDVVYIIPLNKYMYLQEFDMHVCDYYYHDEDDYEFDYTTINICGDIIPICSKQWTFESHFTYPIEFREIINTLFEKHKNTIPEDLWKIIFSNIDRFHYNQ